MGCSTKMYELDIYGLAGHKTLKRVRISPDEIKKRAGESLMQYLRSLSIPIASSCLGDGVCEKCVIFITQLEKKEVLSCQLSLKDIFIDNIKKIKVEVSYL